MADNEWNITPAGTRYHGRKTPPKRVDYKVELDAVVSHPQQGIVPDTLYAVENVTGKLIVDYQDVLTYRIRFTEKAGIPIASNILVQVAPILASHQRRGGAPEAAFVTRDWIEYAPKDSDFVCTPAYSMVRYKGTNYIKEIYFVLEDTNIERVPPPPKGKSWDDRPSHAKGTGPVWKLAVNSSMIMAKMFPEQWVALRPVHPDPMVDPGVPIEERPAQDVRWAYYRKQTSYPIFKGKLSGTTWKDLMNERRLSEFRANTGFKGNPETRYGRMTEPHVMISSLLWHVDQKGKDARMGECGTFEYPPIPDVVATPDAIMFDGKMTYNTLPKWFRTLLLEDHQKNKTPDPRTQNFNRGVFEAKTTMWNSKGKNGVKLGPVFKAEHVPQLFAEMICTGTYWAVYVRYCKETDECRAYRIYRKPEVARAFLGMVKRMRQEMINGTPFLQASTHETNQKLIDECKRYAHFYNTPDASTKKNNYFIVPWKKDVIDRFEKLCGEYDLTVSDEEFNLHDAVTLAEQKGRSGGGGQKAVGSKKGTKTAKRGRKEADDEEPFEPPKKSSAVEYEVAVRTVQQQWATLLKTCKGIDEHIVAEEWEELQGENAMQQITLRCMDLEKDIRLAANVLSAEMKRQRKNED